MDSKRAQELFQKYAPGLAYVAVRGQDGNEGIGTAFHVGEGVFVTARHVVEGKTILEVKPTAPEIQPITKALPFTEPAKVKYIEVLGREPGWPVFCDALSILEEPRFHRDPQVDVAVFRTNHPGSALPYLPLGTHLDEWIRNEQFVLSEAVILGYPPIPLTVEPVLVATRAEINCVINTWKSRHSQFILSSMPRGGFSGGAVISEWDFVLGLVTESLVLNGAPSELGFLNVLSIEPILECLGDAKMLPECQRQNWKDFWNTSTTCFSSPTTLMFVATISRCDDGRQCYLDIHCHEDGHFESVSAIAESSLSPPRFMRESTRKNWARWTAKEYSGSNVELIANTSIRVMDRLSNLGLRRSDWSQR
jgi:hypothetical protein